MINMYGQYPPPPPWMYYPPPPTPPSEPMKKPKSPHKLRKEWEKQLKFYLRTMGEKKDKKKKDDKKSPFSTVEFWAIFTICSPFVFLTYAGMLMWGVNHLVDMVRNIH